MFVCARETWPILILLLTPLPAFSPRGTRRNQYSAIGPNCDLTSVLRFGLSYRGGVYIHTTFVFSNYLVGTFPWSFLRGEEKVQSLVPKAWSSVDGRLRGAFPTGPPSFVRDLGTQPTEAPFFLVYSQLCSLRPTRIRVDR